MRWNYEEEYGGSSASFLPEGWMNIDRTVNRLSVFSETILIEEKFSDIAK